MNIPWSWMASRALSKKQEAAYWASMVLHARNTGAETLDWNSPDVLAAWNLARAEAFVAAVETQK